MVSRIDSGISTRLGGSAERSPVGGSPYVPQIGEQVSQVLFARRPPPIVNADSYPELAAILKQLRKYKGKLAVMAGDAEHDYELVLAEGSAVMIDAHGMIYLGGAFLQAFRDQLPVLVGALGHEIGHRPKRWGEYKTQQTLTKAELEELCRHEETRADIFAGKALAELGMDCEPLAQLLLSTGETSHPEYFPGSVRAQVIRDAHAGRSYRAENRRKLFPGFDRMTAPKGHLGEY